MTTTTLDLTVRRPFRSTLGAVAAAVALVIAISAAALQLWPAATSDAPAVPAVRTVEPSVASADALERRASAARSVADAPIGSADALERRGIRAEATSGAASFGSPDAAERWTSK